MGEVCGICWHLGGFVSDFNKLDALKKGLSSLQSQGFPYGPLNKSVSVNLSFK